MTDDIIELTIYSDITHVDIANHTDVQDMSIAALSLMPKLQTVWASGGPITNLGLIMIGAAHTVTKLDLSKYAFSTAPSPIQHARPTMTPPPTPPPLFAPPHALDPIYLCAQPCNFPMLQYCA